MNTNQRTLTVGALWRHESGSTVPRIRLIGKWLTAALGISPGQRVTVTISGRQLIIESAPALPKD